MNKQFLLDNNMLKQVRREVEIHYHCSPHVNIISLYGMFQNKENIYLVLEYASRGSLSQNLRENPKGFDKEQVKRYMYQMIKAINYLHKRSVIHRDLKLENILLDGQNNIKIADFGCAVHALENQRRSFCGSIHYLAPEMLKK